MNKDLVKTGNGSRTGRRRVLFHSEVELGIRVCPLKESIWEEVKEKDHESEKQNEKKIDPDSSFCELYGSPGAGFPGDPVDPVVSGMIYPLIISTAFSTTWVNFSFLMLPTRYRMMWLSAVNSRLALMLAGCLRFPETKSV